MSETAGSGTAWLPPALARRHAVEDAHERAEARRAKAERQDRDAERHERALASYRAAAEARGEVVSAMEVARGEVGGRELGDIFADAAAAGDREDARQASRDRREDVVFIDREPVIHGASRSAWPESEYELGRMLREAGELHRDRIAYEARQASRGGRAAEHLEAVCLTRKTPGPGTEITRYAPTPACSGCGHVRCQCR
jgi:hypothetical protein